MKGVDWSKVDWDLLLLISPMLIIAIGLLNFLLRQNSDRPRQDEIIMQRALDALLEARNIERMKDGKHGLND